MFTRDDEGKEVPASLNLYDGLLYIDGQKEPVIGMPVCPDCKGRATFPGDSVPYGMGNTRLPDEPCETCYGTGMDLASVRDALVGAFEQGVEFGLQRFGLAQDSLALNNAIEREITERFPKPT